MSELDDYLDTYLAEHQEQYTREALTQVLLDAGHDPEAIAAAWERLERSHSSATPSAPAPGPGRGPTFLTVFGTIVVVLAYGVSIVAALAAIAVGGAVSVLMVAYVAAMIAGLVYSVRRITRTPSAGTSEVAIALAISVAIFVGLSGTCFVLLGPAINASGGIL